MKIGTAWEKRSTFAVFRGNRDDGRADRWFKRWFKRTFSCLYFVCRRYSIYGISSGRHPTVRSLRFATGHVFFSNTQQPSGLLDTHDWQFSRIQESHLYEQRCLVPPDVLVRDFPVFEFHYQHVRKVYSLARGRDSRQQVVPLCVVGEAEYEFVDH